MINQINNPKDVREQDCPLIVFSDHTSGLVEFFIKLRTRGSYNHVMWMKRPGWFASQGNTYSEAPISRYMKRGNRLKFVRVIGLTDVQRRLIMASIDQKLALPWYKKLYDWVGIFGQALGMTWINTPGLEYCSEDVPHHLLCLAEYLPDDPADSRREDIRHLPRHASPQALNEYCMNHPYTFQCVGKWESDDEISTTNRGPVSGWLCVC